MADNPLTAIVAVEVDGESRKLQFTWDAIARVNAAFGEAGFDLMDPSALAEVAGAGFAAHEPELTPDRLREISPPVLPLVMAVRRAWNLAHYGEDLLPDDDDADAGEADAKKKGPALPRFFARLFGRASGPPSSGG